MLVLSIITVILMLAVALFLTMRPFLQPAAPIAPKVDSAANAELDKETVLSTLNEIEFEYKMNKLSEQDYKLLTDRYKALAVQVMQQTDSAINTSGGRTQPGGASELEKRIEREIEAEVTALRQKARRGNREE
ncbi:hypothetical protein [Effusibacillus lacus]|uniref:C-type cytochrome biogenesis protein CcmI n=1 Tax=Effusibacillus lacus TaxID=1348429 RepID=A0A292YQB6_9BACL|nr:hypothetical protein [Effusibacillus lacus]TCS76112.1 hypothetical protein EDD64_10484 [Effusibacillus lacus]GAX91376.1 hypothetical protein EFBL_3045 [Effusibacillus lacus]